MPQSLSKVLLHIVFSTKNRINLIPTSLEKELHAYLAKACRTQGCEAYRIGGTENHIHIACSLSRTLSISQLVEEIKKSSSAWMKRRDPQSLQFSWQGGYGVFSLGFSQLNTLIRYIDQQKEHHQKKDFKEEMFELFKKYRVKYDERYLWD